jgi:uncharacterized membrane protein HdeD (DUF308 family)
VKSFLRATATSLGVALLGRSVEAAPVVWQKDLAIKADYLSSRRKLADPRAGHLDADPHRASGVGCVGGIEGRRLCGWRWWRLSGLVGCQRHLHSVLSTLEEENMPADHTEAGLSVVLILAGLFLLGDVTLTTFINTMIIAVTAIVAGGFDIIHAIWKREWGGSVWQALLGALYVAVGIVLLNQPDFRTLILTYVLGLLLLMSGFVRVVLSVSYWKDAGPIMLLSGVFGILAGLVVLTGFPRTTLWALGVLLGIDLVGHGLAWINCGWLRPSRRDGKNSAAAGKSRESFTVGNRR